MGSGFHVLARFVRGTDVSVPLEAVGYGPPRLC